MLIVSVSMATVVFANDARLPREIGDIYSTREALPAIPVDRMTIEIDMSTVPYVVGDGYIDFKLDFDEILAEIAPFNAGSVTGNNGMLNAFFPPGATFTESPIIFFNWENNISIPWTAQVTDVTFTSQVTSVPGVSYFVTLYVLHEGQWFFEEFRWNSSIRSNNFNGAWARTQWAFDFFATRVIQPPNPIFPTPDPGAGATMRSATLRVSFR